MIFRRISMAVLLALSLTACADPRPVGTSEDNHIAYEKYGITRLNVNEVQIVDYPPTFHAPHVEHQLLVPPYTAVRDWARNRFRAVGNMGVAKVEILDASIIQRDVPVKNDALIGVDTMQSQFKLRIQVRIEINSPSYVDLPYAETIVTRVMWLPEGASKSERDRMLQNSLAEAMDTLDDLMTQTIRLKWNNIVR